MKEFGWSLLASLITSLIVLRIAHVQRRWGFDDAYESVRKLHPNPVPRLGGAGINAVGSCLDCSGGSAF